jgi:hypothetical protein
LTPTVGAVTQAEGEEAGAQNKWRISIDAPVQPGTRFFVLFVALGDGENAETRMRAANIDSAQSAGGNYGPFEVYSKVNEAGEAFLEVDTEEFEIPEGTYSIKFTDEDRQYIGETEPVTVKADAAMSASGSGNSGGCAAGFDTFALIAAAGGVFLLRKRDGTDKMDKAA